MRFDAKRSSAVILAVLSLAVVLLSGCTGGNFKSAATTNGKSGPTINPLTGGTMTPYQMLLPEAAITSMLSSCTGTELGYMAGSKPFVIMQETEEPYPTTPPDNSSISGWSPQYMIRFYSEEDMKAQFVANEIPSYVTWIMYDNEPNITPPTPTVEQDNVAEYVGKAATVIHNNGLKFIFTGGLADGSQHTAVWATAGQMDAYDVQTQTSEDTNYGPPSDYWTASDDIATHFLTNNSALTITAGFGNWDGTNILPISEIDKNIESLPAGGNTSRTYLESGTNVPIWANFGAHGSNPSAYPDLCTILANTINTPPSGGSF